MINGNGGAPSTTARDFESELRDQLARLVDLMNEAARAGETFGFGIGTNADGVIFLEKLHVTKSLLSPGAPR